MGGAQRDDRASARRSAAAFGGPARGRTDAGRYRDRQRRAARAVRAERAFSGSRAMTTTPIQNTLAVALHYDRKGAPRVVAKGKGEIAKKIIEVASEHDVAIQENEVLAGALSNVEIGDEIPAELYRAVAEVLVFVMRLSGKIR
ncbi:EscU/YscU/HrcU family type III secretion system export apparatus switch protein [Afipia felis]|nr:EscU/YscU/HrcU family type III secretion system export apparatus switch protein [Afipia felis]